jgi:hypothetical protein
LNSIQGKKNVVADALSLVDVDILKIQEEENEDKEALTLLSGSENSIISNIKLTIPMHTALIFKEQAKVRKKVFTQYIFKGIYIPQSLRQKVMSFYYEYLLHPWEKRIEKTIWNTMKSPSLTQDFEH